MTYFLVILFTAAILGTCWGLYKTLGNEPNGKVIAAVLLLTCLLSGIINAALQNIDKGAGFGVGFLIICLGGGWALRYRAIRK